MLRLLALLFEDTKDDLLNKATPTTFAALQGEALAYQEMIRKILTVPLTNPKGD